MSGARIGRTAVKVADSAVNTFVLFVILAMLVVGCYGVWDSKQVYRNADASRFADYDPTTTASKMSFSDLQAINPDVIAWLTVYGTHIDYPVTHYTDNMKYLNTDSLGRYSLSGSLFLDADNHPDFSDFNNIIYGHHMDANTMFGEIGLFADQSYFDARQYGSLYYGGQTHGLEFFALVHDDAYDMSVYDADVMGQSQQQAYITRLMSLAVQKRVDVSVTIADRIVMLSTCSSYDTDGRDILVGKITADVQPDPFPPPPETVHVMETIDELMSFWGHLPMWVQGAIPAAYLLAVCAVTIYLKVRNRREVRGACGEI